MDLAAARNAVADLLNDLDVDDVQLNIRPAPPVQAPIPGDGWVVPRRIAPGQFFGGAVAATLNVFVVAGPDEAAAEAFASAWSVPILRATLLADLGAQDVSVEQATVLVGSANTPLYALVATATIEVE